MHFRENERKHLSVADTKHQRLRQWIGLCKAANKTKKNKRKKRLEHKGVPRRSRQINGEKVHQRTEALVK
jgi:hypothetical protein